MPLDTSADSPVPVRTVLQLVGGFNPYSAANLKRRKRETLDFIRHALFVNPRHSIT